MTRHSSARAQRGAGKQAEGGLRNDAISVVGLGTLMNKKNVNPKIDLDDMEKSILGKKTSHKKDPVQDFNNELKTLSRELDFDLDVDFGIDDARAAPPTMNGGPAPQSSSESSDGSRRGGRRASRPARAAIHNPLGKKAKPFSFATLPGSSSESGSSESGSSESGSSESESGSSESGSSESGSTESDSSGRGRRHRGAAAQHRIGSRHERGPGRSHHDSEKRDQLSSMVDGMHGSRMTGMGADREDEEDSKASRIEQISQLRTILEEEGINCEGVAIASMEMPLDKINAIYDLLRRKNDRNRYSTLAEEGFLFGAEVVETVFDGSTEVPVLGWKPDYTGFHNTVLVKLHRMRYETSQLVASFIERHDVKPMTRILLELLPSFILYPKQNKRQRGDTSLRDDLEGKLPRNSSKAMSQIRASDAMNNI